MVGAGDPVVVGGLAVLSVPATNNELVGVGFSTGNGTVMNAVAANNNGYGLGVAAANCVLANIAAAHNAYVGIVVDGDDAYFTGLVKAGSQPSDCMVIGGTNPGIDADCNPQDASDFGSPHLGVTLVYSFVGKVGTDGPVDTSQDSVNPDDDGSPGTAPYDTITLWTDFENLYRGWGPDTSPFVGVCGSGICRIWDWRLTDGDTGDPNGGGVGVPGPVLMDQLPVPTGNDTLEHRWYVTALDQAACDVNAPASRSWRPMIAAPSCCGMPSSSSATDTATKTVCASPTSTASTRSTSAAFRGKGTT